MTIETNINLLDPDDSILSFSEFKECIGILNRREPASPLFVRHVLNQFRYGEPRIQLFLSRIVRRSLRGIFALEEKKENRKYKIICQGGQNNNWGSIDEKIAKEYCSKLNENNEGVLFRTEALESNLGGGTCSAMSFDFANHYLNARNHLSPEETIFSIAPEYQSSSLYFRTRQAALNTICKDYAHPPEDFKQAKISSMLRLDNRKVIAASEELNLYQQNTADKIANILNQFQEGTFVVRMICPANNHKEEAYGHSTILIREKERRYFYDPNEGIYELEKDAEAESLREICRDINDHYNVPIVRIYQIV